MTDKDLKELEDQLICVHDLLCSLISVLSKEYTDKKEFIKKFGKEYAKFNDIKTKEERQKAYQDLLNTD